MKQISSKWNTLSQTKPSAFYLESNFQLPRGANLITNCFTNQEICLWKCGATIKYFIKVKLFVFLFITKSFKSFLQMLLCQIFWNIFLFRRLICMFSFRLLSEVWSRATSKFFIKVKSFPCFSFLVSIWLKMFQVALIPHF